MRILFLLSVIALFVTLGFVVGALVNYFTGMDPLISLGVGMIIISFMVCGFWALTEK